MTFRHHVFRWPTRLGSNFQWERRVLRDRLGVLWVTYVLKLWVGGGYVSVSGSVSPRAPRSEVAALVRGLRERLRYLAASRAAQA